MTSEKTTIQLDRATKELLDRIRQEKKANSYAETIRLLAKETLVLEKSEIGSLPKLKPFSRDKHNHVN